MCHFRFLLVSILIDFYGVGVRAALSLIAYTLLMLRLVNIVIMLVLMLMLMLLLRGGGEGCPQSYCLHSPYAKVGPPVIKMLMVVIMLLSVEFGSHHEYNDGHPPCG